MNFKFIMICWVLATLAHADEPRRLEVYPQKITLSDQRDAQAMIARIVEPDGVTHDVTGSAKYIIGNAALAKIENHLAMPLADGQTEIKVQCEGLSATVSLTVEHAKVDPPISFKRDVMPVFLRSGCNSGACHGAARGKDGFRLSLFGYDAEGDYFRLTREMSARRINLAMPEESLVLQKATGSAPHTGGKRFEKGSSLYDTLKRWIEAGAPKDATDVALPVSAEILPKQILLQGADATQQLVVRAKYSDGSERDVTSLVLFLSNNENSAKVSPDGLVTAAADGEAFVMARFATFTVGAEVSVISKEIKYVWKPMAEQNYIDGFINRKLQRLRQLPSELCGDEEFLRRVSLDIAGLLPTTEEHDRFVASAEPDKRAKLIDELLTRKEFVEMWVMRWAEMLQIRSGDQVSYKSALVYYDWLKERLGKGEPVNQLVKELVSSSGGSFENPAASFYQFETDPQKLAEDTAQAFLGIRVQCAQCHNHPFDQWTMNDYQGFVAFFTQIGRKKGEDPRETIVFNRAEGEAKHPVTNQPVAPKFLGGNAPETKGSDRRKALGDWLSANDNPYFARHVANVVWQHFFGRGIIEPIDDVRVSNPPSNAELLDALGGKLVEYNYDFKKLVRDICNSRTYQLSSRTNETNELDQRNFSHSAIRRLRAEVLLDCISQVTQTPNKFRGLPLGGRAVEIADGQTSSYFLKTFGRASRETACSCEVAMEPNLSQALHLINGDTVQQKIGSGAVVKTLLSENRPAPEIASELYLRCLGRKPTESELRDLEPHFADEKQQGKAVEDLFWALLNCKEFMFNH